MSPCHVRTYVCKYICTYVSVQVVNEPGVEDRRLRRLRGSLRDSSPPRWVLSSMCVRTYSEYSLTLNYSFLENLLDY